VPSEPPSCVNDGIIGYTQAVTLWGLFCERVRRSRDRVAYRDYDLMNRNGLRRFSERG